MSTHPLLADDKARTKLGVSSYVGQMAILSDGVFHFDHQRAAKGSQLHRDAGYAAGLA